MTRKRFIKLMMADGYSRNKAVEMAKEVAAVDGGCYSTAYALFADVFYPIEELAKRVVEALPRVIEVIAGALKNVAESISQFADALLPSTEE